MTQQAGSVDCGSSCGERALRGWQGLARRRIVHWFKSQWAPGQESRRPRKRPDNEKTSSWCFEIRNPAPNVLSTLYLQRHCLSSHTHSPTHHSLFIETVSSFRPTRCHSPLGKIPSVPADICKIILAVILPPVGVFLEVGCGSHLLINILLTILGYIPGIIHALYVILKF
ncbi:hypothetical protein E4U34_006072 [Claviceps purpurea]|nr:hypothetical protein E4U34_006072 [Claviceps purpurea]